MYFPVTNPPPPYTRPYRVTSRRKTNIPLLPRALAKRAVSGDKNTILVVLVVRGTNYPMRILAKK